MKDVRELAGASSADWSGNFPAEVWAKEILETAVAEAVLLNRSRIYRSETKIYVPKHVNFTSVNWQTTVGQEPTDTDYDINSIVLDPVRYRARIPIDLDSIKENTFNVIGDVKQGIKDAVKLKIDDILWATFTNATLANAGCQYVVCGADATVDAGDVLTIPKIKEAMKKVFKGSNTKPDTLVIPAEGWEVLINNEEFTNAAKFGDDSVVKTGRIARWLGMDVFVTNQVPTYGAGGVEGDFNTEGYEAVVFNSKGFLAACVSESLELVTKRNEDKYQMVFYPNFKMDAKVADSNYGCIIAAAIE